MALGASLRKALTLWRLPSRGTVLLFATVIALLLGSWLLAHRAAANLLDSLRWFGSPEYAAISVGLGGTIEITNVRLHAPDPREPDVFQAQLLRIETPGLHWLVWNSLTASPSAGGLSDFLGSAQLARVQQTGGVPLAFPAAGNLALQMEGFTPGPGLARAGDLEWIGLTSGAPMDAEGCDGRTRFDAKTLGEIGLGDTATRVNARFSVTSADNATLNFALERPGSSRIELDMSIRVEHARHLADTNWANVVILDRKWTARDQGFVSARNRWCAVKMGISRDGFVERHMGALKRVLAEFGATPTDELEAAYRRYASRGGVITFHSRPNLTTPVGQLARFTPAERLRILNATLESVRGRGAPFRFSFDVPVVSVVEEGALTTQSSGDGYDPAEASAGVAAASTAASPGPTSGGRPGNNAGAVSATSSVSAPIVPTAMPRVPTPPPVVARAPGTDVRLPEAPATTPRSAPTSAALAAPPSSTIATRPTVSIPTSDPPAEPAAGRKLTYRDLAQLEGRRIRVSSTYGSVRIGTLEKYTDTAITVRLEQRERGLSVTMPHQTVRDVQLIEYRPLLDTPPAGG